MKRYLPFFIIFFVVLLITKPFFRPGYFPTHDGEWAVVRMGEMGRELKDLQIPPRWADNLNHGYGYPLFNFTYPSPFYLGSILRAVNIGLVDSVKIIFVLSVFISGLFMFLLGRELGGNYGGLFASIFYTVAPFRLVNLYVRGSIGESVSLALFPMLTYFSLKFILKPTIVYFLICSFTLAMLILSHNVMALVFFLVWLVYLYIILITYFEDVKLYTFRYILPLVLLGLGLTAYFFVPALLERENIILSQVKLADAAQHFINLPDYLLSPWSYGPKPSYQLGWTRILTAILGIAAIFLAKEIDKRKYLALAAFIYGGIFLLMFFAHPFSADFWNVPPLSWFDFPWRFLTPLAFFLALSSIFLTLHRTTRIIGVIFTIIIVVFSLNFAKPQEYFDKGDNYYLTNDATTTSADELMPVWVGIKPTNRYAKKVEVDGGKATITELEYNSKRAKFRVAADLPSRIKINTIYYPGWNVMVDDKPVQIDYKNPQGTIKFDMLPGNHEVVAQFKETSLRFWSNIITLVSLFVIFILFLASFLARLKHRLI